MPRKKTGDKPKRTRQPRIPGTESKVDKNIRQKAEDYLQDKVAHKEATDAINASKAALITAMEKAGLETYHEGDLYVTITPGDTKLTAKRTSESSE